MQIFNPQQPGFNPWNFIWYPKTVNSNFWLLARCNPWEYRVWLQNRNKEKIQSSLFHLLYYAAYCVVIHFFPYWNITYTDFLFQPHELFFSYTGFLTSSTTIWKRLRVDRPIYRQASLEDTIWGGGGINIKIIQT